MKKILLFALLVLYFLGDNYVKAQTRKIGNVPVNLEAFAGYGRTLYDLDEHSQAGFISAGMRAVYYNMPVEIGAEAKFHIMSPTFTLEHPFYEKVAYEEKFRFHYIGTVFRYYPLDEEYFFGRAGAGWVFNNRKVFLYEEEYVKNEGYIDDDKDKKRVNLTNPFSFNLGVGGAIPFKGNDKLMASLLYYYKKNVLAEDEDVSYTAGHLSLQFTFVF